MTRESAPWLLVEIKLSDQPLVRHHLTTAEALGGIPVAQVCQQDDIALAQREGVYRLSANRFFA